MAVAQLEQNWDSAALEPPAGMSPQTGRPVLVVIGCGPVGLQFARELLQRGYPGLIKLFGDEPWRPYNRIQLSSLLAGEVRYNDILYPEISARERQFHFLNRRVVTLDAQARMLRDDKGVSHHFDQLVFATGSQPWVPNVQGMDLAGIYVFRDLNDAQELMARSVRTRRTLVVGGGLLGVEAARAMQRNHTQVALVHQSNRLMNRQLDIEAGAILKRTLEGYGIEVFLNAGVRALQGSGRVEKVELRNGATLACDTVIFATGIQPNVELARASGVGVGRGIAVDDQLQTNLPGVYAIGECAEHRGSVYGLLAPGLEQAAVLADRLCEGDAHYQGSMAATQLKILDLPIFTMGWIGDEYEQQIDASAVFHSPQGDYCKLLLRRNRLKGLVAVGECPQRSRMQQALLGEQRLYPWQLARFRKTGRLWPDSAGQQVADWPAAAIVCNCRAVTKGTLARACGAGCDSVETLARETGASTVCGSCKPLLAELVGAPAPAPSATGSRPLLTVVSLGLILALLTLVLPGPVYSEQFAAASWLEQFWTDGLLKQITGFTLLGLSVVALLISLRKRVSRVRLGGFPWWRLFHTVLGLVALVVLYLHTGFALGANLNQYLMLNFVLLALVGALAGVVIGREHRATGSYLGKQLRQWFTHAHIVLFWPLPILLGFHVLSVYFF